MQTTYSISNEVETSLQSCSTTLGCFEALVVSLLALLLWAGFSTGLLFAPLTNVRGALRAIKAERSCVAAERDALEQFAKRVADAPTSQPGGTAVQTQGLGVATISSSTTTSGMQVVEKAYRETVMAVDHFEEDYGETFAEHLAGEVGEDLAAAVVANEKLTPQVQRALVQSAREGCRKRDQYIDALERERDQLADTRRLFDRVAENCEALDGKRLRRRSFEELQDRFESLQAEQERLSETLSERQERLHDGMQFGWERCDTESVHGFLYREMDVTYPVLADGSELLERAKAVEKRLTTALTARV